MSRSADPKPLAALMLLTLLFSSASVRGQDQPFKDQAAVYRDRSGVSICALGDSITDMSSDNTSRVTQFAADGYMTWAQTLTGHRAYFDDSLNFGVSGDTIEKAAARTRLVIASRCQMVVVLLGTNDLPRPESSLKMFNDWRNKVVSPLLNAKVTVVAVAVPPREDMSGAANSKRTQFNAMVKRFVNAEALLGQRISVVDAQDCLTSPSGPGSSLHDSLYDGTHPSPIGAYCIGKSLVGAISRKFPERASPTDEATLNTNPAMIGADGLTLAPAQGQVATGYKAYRGAGTSDKTTFSVAKPREAAGCRDPQQVVVDISGQGSSAETYIVQPEASPTSGVKPGVAVQLVAQVQFAEPPVNLVGFELHMAEVGPPSPRQAIDMVRQPGQPMPRVAWGGVLKTPPFVLQPGTTSITSYIRAVMDASKGVGSVNFYVCSYRMRIVR